MSTAVMNPHDKYFKNAMSHYCVARQFFEEYLSKTVLNRIELTSLERVQETFIDEDMKAFSADIIYKVKLINSDNILYLLEGYKIKSSINTDEKNHFNTMLRGAAMRILVTRLHDLIFQPSDGIVVPKNPNDYLIILKWHQENNIWAT